jgi:hypothetical protein
VSRAAVFKWLKRFRDGETNVKMNLVAVGLAQRLFHYPPEACGKRPAARFRESSAPCSQTLPTKVPPLEAETKFHTGKTKNYSLVYFNLLVLTEQTGKQKAMNRMLATIPRI